VGFRNAAIGLMVAASSCVTSYSCLAQMRPDPLSARLSAPWPGPMRLGVDSHDLQAGRERSASAATPASKCGKLRRIASRLGETHAGVILRNTLIERTCAFADISPGETPWGWPWSAAGLNADLPPRIHASYGAWTIRCGSTGQSERCALIHQGEVNVAPLPGALDRVNLISHFVINHIGGQERVLGRVFVERAESHWFGDAASMLDVPTHVEPIRVNLGGRIVHEPFDGCSRAGCLMEADVATSSSMATLLSDGTSAALEVRPSAGVVLYASVSAAGFRQGLQELTRLKRAEPRLLAGR
jgi:invasion protein IalB